MVESFSCLGSNTPFNVKSLGDARYRQDILQLSGLSNKFPMTLSDAFDHPQKTCCMGDSVKGGYGQMDADLDGGR